MLSAIRHIKSEYTSLYKIGIYKVYILVKSEYTQRILLVNEIRSYMKMKFTSIISRQVVIKLKARVELTLTLSNMDYGNDRVE